MGWAVGFDGRWNRDVGYGVPAWCDHPGCPEEIDRGLAHVCGGEPYGGDRGCGLHFCAAHLWMVDDDGDGMVQVCERCVDLNLDDNGQATNEWFEPKPDHPEWVVWKLTDESWSEWREKNSEKVAAMASTNPANVADPSHNSGETA